MEKDQTLLSLRIDGKVCSNYSIVLLHNRKDILSRFIKKKTFYRISIFQVFSRGLKHIFHQVTDTFLFVKFIIFRI